MVFEVIKRDYIAIKLNFKMLSNKNASLAVDFMNISRKNQCQSFGA